MYDFKKIKRVLMREGEEGSATKLVLVTRRLD